MAAIIHVSVCGSAAPVNNRQILLVQSVIAEMPLVVTASAFRWGADAGVLVRCVADTISVLLIVIVTSGQSNLMKGRIAPLVTTNSLVPRGR